MNATPGDQRQILDIQGMDFRVTTLQNKLAALPEIAELQGITQRAAVVHDLIVASETQISDIKHELLRSEADVEQVASRLEKDEKRLADGSTSPKELERLQHEVQSLSARRAELEEVELEIMLRIDSVKERLEALKAEEIELDAKRAEVGGRKDVACQHIEQEIDSVQQERAATAASVDAPLLTLYEKIRAGNNGTGAAAMRAGRCEGCHLPINSVEISRIKELPEDEVVRCEECRCILVRGVS